MLSAPITWAFYAADCRALITAWVRFFTPSDRKIAVM
jgi:hypothetical protein